MLSSVVDSRCANHPWLYYTQKTCTITKCNSFYILIYETSYMRTQAQRFESQRSPFAMAILIYLFSFWAIQTTGCNFHLSSVSLSDNSSILSADIHGIIYIYWFCYWLCPFQSICLEVIYTTFFTSKKTIWISQWFLGLLSASQRGWIICTKITSSIETWRLPICCWALIMYVYYFEFM